MKRTPEEIKEETMETVLETKVSKEVKDELIKLAHSNDKSMINIINLRLFVLPQRIRLDLCSRKLIKRQIKGILYLSKLS